MPFCFVGILTCQKKQFPKNPERGRKNHEVLRNGNFPTVRPTTAFLDSPIRFFVPQK